MHQENASKNPIEIKYSESEKMLFETIRNPRGFWFCRSSPEYPINIFSSKKFASTKRKLNSYKFIKYICNENEKTYQNKNITLKFENENYLILY